MQEYKLFIGGEWADSSTDEIKKTETGITYINSFRL